MAQDLTFRSDGLMSQKGFDKPGFTQHGLMSQSKNWFHTDGLMSQKGSGKPDFTQNGLMSQRGVDESGFTPAVRGFTPVQIPAGSRDARPFSPARPKALLDQETPVVKRLVPETI